MNEQDRTMIPDALQDACRAARELTEQGCTLIAAYANGRRAVLIVDQPPDGVAGVVKRRHPSGNGGTTVVRAASFLGCQVEWLRDYPAPAQPQLQVVGHG